MHYYLYHLPSCTSSRKVPQSLSCKSRVLRETDGRMAYRAPAQRERQVMGRALAPRPRPPPAPAAALAQASPCRAWRGRGLWAAVRERYRHEQRGWGCGGGGVGGVDETHAAERVFHGKRLRGTGHVERVFQAGPPLRRVLRAHRAAEQQPRRPSPGRHSGRQRQPRARQQRHALSLLQPVLGLLGQLTAGGGRQDLPSPPKVRSHHSTAPRG